MHYLFILFSLFFVGCCPLPIHVKEAHKLMNAFTNKANEENLFLVGSGGAMMDDIQEIILQYGSNQKLTVDQARMLFVKKAESLLTMINDSQKIRPFLHNYPFTSQNIFFSISFYDADNGLIDPPYIAYVSMDTRRNRIRYLVNDEANDDLKLVYDEPYEEALRIYNEALMQGAKWAQ